MSFKILNIIQMQLVYVEFFALFTELCFFLSISNTVLMSWF